MDKADMIIGLSEEEWNELVSLEYLITWKYTDNYDEDEKRYMELSKKRWDELERIKREKSINELLWE